MAGTCEAHRWHRPKNLTVEQHHVIPQAWQAFWHPPGQAPPVIVHGVAAVKLWDPRTVTLCPTGHRNVHYWIVRLMHATPGIPGRTDVAEDPLAYKLAVFGTRRLSAEQASAYLTLCRWREAGGSLLALVRAGQFGQA